MEIKKLTMKILKVKDWLIVREYLSQPKKKMIWHGLELTFEITPIGHIEIKDVIKGQWL